MKRTPLLIVALVLVLSLAVAPAIAQAATVDQVNPPSTELTPDLLAGAAGFVLSLAFSYVPRLNTSYAALAEETKRLTMLGLVVALAAGAYGLSCAGVLAQLFNVQLACSQAGLLGLVRSVMIAAIINQTTYKLSPQTAAVKRIKASGA